MQHVTGNWRFQYVSMLCRIEQAQQDYIENHATLEELILESPWQIRKDRIAAQWIAVYACLATEMRPLTIQERAVSWIVNRARALHEGFRNLCWDVAEWILFGSRA